MYILPNCFSYTALGCDIGNIYVNMSQNLSFGIHHVKCCILFSTFFVFSIDVRSCEYAEFPTVLVTSTISRKNCQIKDTAQRGGGKFNSSHFIFAARSALINGILAESHQRAAAHQHFTHLGARNSRRVQNTCAI